MKKCEKKILKLYAWVSPNTCVPTFTWHHNLVASHTLGGELVAVAVVAEQRIILAGEGFVCQRAITAETAEAVLMIMSVFIKKLLTEEQKAENKDTEGYFIHLWIHSWKVIHIIIMHFLQNIYYIFFYLSFNVSELWWSGGRREKNKQQQWFLDSTGSQRSSL